MDMITSSGQLLLSGSIGKRGSRRVLKVCMIIEVGGMMGNEYESESFLCTYKRVTFSYNISLRPLNIHR